jgi:hypothetical protein
MSVSSRDLPVKSKRHIPPFFDKIREGASQRWKQLDDDPELAGPWKQLFAQVQSPRHVLSELLQNADDAGAKSAWAYIDDNDCFVFEHDGRDFDENQFASLCRFGFSNKRNLHTIGFRGVGFKFTFSIGDTVEILTPSLAFRFHKKHFTEPAWLDDAPLCDVTKIIIKIQDINRKEEIKKNLQEWVNSPISLLFFNNLCDLNIGDVKLSKDILSSGPVEYSQKIRLSGFAGNDLILFRSPEEPFPDDVIKEIQQERNWDDSDFQLPPCSVEIVYGLSRDQRLFVVLPTGVKVDLPFSCNAPFLQDPVRNSIKSPSISPTNRWLLERIGRLTGKSFLDWLYKQTLSISAEICDSPPFSLLKDLGIAIEHCLADISELFSRPEEKSWIKTLASCIARIKIPDEKVVSEIRANAQRLGITKWYQVKEIRVTPYIDGAPVGTESSVEILWHEDKFLVKSGSPAKIHKSVVAELSKRFNTDIAEAFKACYERDDEYILEYMQENFELEEAQAFSATDESLKEGTEPDASSSSPAAGATTSGKLPVADADIVEVGSVQPENEDEQEVRFVSKRHDQPIALFAASREFKWDSASERYIRPDGCIINKCEAPFHYELISPDGEILRRFWVSEQSIVRGVELPAEIWDLLTNYPSSTSLILTDEQNHLAEFSGEEIIRMKDAGLVKLYPSKYRIRKE